MVARMQKTDIFDIIFSLRGSTFDMLVRVYNSEHFAQKLAA